MDRGYPNGIPDYAGLKEEAGKSTPSWRRICKSLLRNDYWCKGLSFTQTKSDSYDKYLKVMKRRREKWGIIEMMVELVAAIESMPVTQKIDAINAVKLRLHEISPFKDEPVDCVLWVLCEQVQANDYNPNAVAPPEMRLLQHSIREDGYIQPIVGYFDDEEHIFEVVDGFHRTRVGKECDDIKKRVEGICQLPLSTRTDRSARIG